MPFFSENISIPDSEKIYSKNCEKLKCSLFELDGLRFQWCEMRNLNNLKSFIIETSGHPSDDFEFFLLKRNFAYFNKYSLNSNDANVLNFSKKYNVLIRLRENHLCKLRYCIIAFIINNCITTNLMNEFLTNSNIDGNMSKTFGCTFSNTLGGCKFSNQQNVDKFDGLDFCKYSQNDSP